MDATDTLILRRTLDALRRIGPAGMTRRDILDLAEIAACSPMTEEQRERLWQLLTGRRYVAGHYEPITNAERHALTERGLEALEAL